MEDGCFIRLLVTLYFYYHLSQYVLGYKNICHFVINFYFVYRGCGIRWLNVIPPDSEGYTGSQIKSASASGKTMLYVIPLQEELDLNPLPNDAREFRKMPKATCQMCNKSMPLQVLALHIQVCKSKDSTSSNEEVMD